MNIFNKNIRSELYVNKNVIITLIYKLNIGEKMCDTVNKS